MLAHSPQGFQTETDCKETFRFSDLKTTKIKCMKKNLTTGEPTLHAIKKALLLMKLSFLLVLAASLQVSAKVSGQGTISAQTPQHRNFQGTGNH